MSQVPQDVLTQHLAVLGKTGSGKTSTAKLAIEQVVAEGARVCVLDPIKSDWWGLTSSRDGKHPGLPFNIIGGPRGHVPLHSSAGKAVAEIVASGALPLSIIDMADFEPGGIQRFFVAFAETLLKRMRGVLYLVIEEAHEFAPKERAGFDAENMAIHLAKKLATSGRSKGIRLILATQRVQSLHNALLGSCDTLIAHRLTAPADQKPVIDWLKANTSKDVLEKVSSSLASLKTGHGWVCSGEAKIFSEVHFSRIQTYDNTATPTGDGETRDVKTAAVDQDRLRAIIGDAVEKAKADDPKELRKTIADLKQQVARAAAQPNPKNEPIRQPSAAEEARAGKIAELRQQLAQHKRALEEAMKILVKVKAVDFSARGGEALEEAVTAAVKQITAGVEKRVTALSERVQGIQAAATAAESAITQLLNEKVELTVTVQKQEPFTISSKPAPPAMRTRIEGTPSEDLPPAKRRILDALAFLAQIGIDRGERAQVAFLADTSPSSSAYANNVSSLKTAGFLDYPSQGYLSLTDLGRSNADGGSVPATSKDLHEAIRSKLPPAKWRILDALIAAHPNAMTREQVAVAAGTSSSSSAFANNISSLRTLGLLDYPAQGQLVAQSVLFLEAR